MLDLKRGSVALFGHDPEWDVEGERTVADLRSVFGNRAIDIHHVGSTSIPTIPAKPIIDIALAAGDFDDVAPLVNSLEAKGYYLRPSQNTPDHLLLAKGSLYNGSGDLQTHFIHVVLKDSRQWFDYLNFREYLLEHPNTAREYAALKPALANTVSTDKAELPITSANRTLLHTPSPPLEPSITDKLSS